MGLTAAELEAVVGIDDSPFSKGLDSLLGKFEGWGGKATGILAGVGAVGGGLFAAGMAAGMNLADVRAQMQAELGLTAKEAERYGGIAGKLYANNYGASLEETSSAVSTVLSSIDGMRKASDSAVEDMTAKALTYAQVFEVDVARATQVAGQAVRQGLAKDAGQAFDLLTAASQKVPAAVREDLLDAVDEYGGMFTQLGIKGPKAFGMLAAAAGKGMYGIDKTGDALKEFTIRATDGSDATQTAFKAIGVDADQMANDLLAGGKRGGRAFQQIVTGLRGIDDPAKQSRAALALFGTPLEDLGTKDIPKFLGSLDAGASKLGKFKGATDKMGDALGGTPSANLATFWRTIKTGTVGALGGALIPAMTTATGWLKGQLGPAFTIAKSAAEQAGHAIAAVAGFVQQNAVPISIVAGLIAAVFIPHLIALGVQYLKTQVLAARTWIVTQAGAIKAAAIHSASVVRMVAGWVLMGVQSMAQAARMAAAWIIAMGPVGWVIAAVVGLAALIIAKWDWISKTTAKVWGAIVGWIKSNAGKIVSVVAGPIGALVVFVVRHWDQIKDTVKSGISAVVGFLKSLPGKAMSALSTLGRAITTPYRLAFTAALDIARNVGGTVVSWIAGIPGKLLNLGGKFASAGKQLLQGFVDGMKNAAGIISGIAGNVWNTVRGLLNSAITKINGALEFTIGLPGKDITINPPDIPQLATGGRATSATLAVIGEGREPESVLPDSVLRGLLERAHDAGASQRGGDGNGRALMRDAVFQVQDRASARELIAELSHALRVADHGGVYA